MGVKVYSASRFTLFTHRLFPNTLARCSQYHFLCICFVESSSLLAHLLETVLERVLFAWKSGWKRGCKRVSKQWTKKKQEVHFHLPLPLCIITSSSSSDMNVIWWRWSKSVINHSCTIIHVRAPINQCHNIL